MMSESQGDEASLAAQRLLSGQAWEDFCNTLREAGRIVDRFGGETSELDRAEWFRFLTRLVRNGFERFSENCEPDRPRLRDAPWRNSINFQSPDQDHFLAEFENGLHDYVIRGNRGGLPYFVIAAWRAKQPQRPGAQNWATMGSEESLRLFDPATLNTTAFISSNQVRFDEHGNFEIVVSRTRPAGGRDWLPITDDCVGLLVRTLYHDRTTTVPPHFHIERCDQPVPRPVTPAEVSDGLAKAGQLVRGYGELVRTWWQDNLG